MTLLSDRRVICLERFASSNGQQTSSVKECIVKMLGHVVSAAGCYSTLLLPCAGSHRQYVNEWVWLCYNQDLFTKTGGRLGWVYGSWLANPRLEERTWTSELDSQVCLLALLPINCAISRGVTVSLTLTFLIWIMQMIIANSPSCFEDK